MTDIELFTEVGSTNFLGFEFSGKSYSQQISEAVTKTNRVCAINCYLRTIDTHKVIWFDHDFGFLGGSLGCAEGEKLVRGIERAIHDRLPVVIECKSGGARMQEGLLSLMQMAKVSVAIESLKKHALPLITICADPTYGGVSASYAMQGTIRIGYSKSRIGFAGPSVILNTMYGMDQNKYDAACPDGFQSAEFLMNHGQLDILVKDNAELQGVLGKLLRCLSPSSAHKVNEDTVEQLKKQAEESMRTNPASTKAADYLATRALDRYLAQDIIKAIFTDFVDLAGDGKIGCDPCLHGGVALFQGVPCVVMAQYKGHNPIEMKNTNFGMASPHGYRTALKLMTMAEQLHYPVFSLVDTPGAYPSFQAEVDGQSESLATNLCRMGGLQVPLITLIVGEGGSGGALGIAMGNRIAMLSKGYYGVITPEGAASILGRYKDDADKARQFPKDCAALAVAQKVYAHDLKRLGCIDEVLEEVDGENYKSFPVLASRICSFFAKSLKDLQDMKPEAVEADRYNKFRSMGNYETYDQAKKESIMIKSAEEKVKAKQTPPPLSRTLQYIANQTLNSPTSALHGRSPKDLVTPVYVVPKGTYDPKADSTTFKYILDHQGPNAVVDALKKSNCVHITDTTMRDAHQSLLSTRVRTHDMLLAADETALKLRKAFSLEMWGGATFDVAFRFLHESPWERLKVLRQRIPNVLFQMLIRGANAVGYKSYPDNVVVESIKLAAANGIDVFRIFDCFNDMEQMQLCIDAVVECNKICEVAICFTGNFLSQNEKIYTLEYYKDMVSKVAKAGAHIIAIKDMAGLLKPQMAEPLMKAIRSVTDLPVHFHTHNTSSAALVTCVEMARAGCSIIDLAMASMSDTTSQPSLNAFVAAMEGSPRAPEGFENYMDLEDLDQLWQQIRTQYVMYESGLKAGTARVYDHQIPGGQFSNLYEQCKSMGLMSRWSEVLDMYRDCNQLLGDLIKVTPSSKCVGDMALYLVTRNMSVEDAKTKPIDWPDSVVDLCIGNIGTPHHGLPEQIVKNVLKGKPRMGANMQPIDLSKLKKDLEAKFNVPMTPEDVISSALYPKVYDDYQLYMKKYGDRVTYLPSNVFFHGMVIGQEVVSSVPVKDKAGQFKDYRIKLTRVGPIKDGSMRTLDFIVNGSATSVTVKDSSKEQTKSDLPVADPADSQQIGAPLPGAVDKISVSAGAMVHEGQVMMVVTAMKMEVNVSAPYAAKVVKVCVEHGMKVDQNTLLVVLEKTGSKPEK